MRIGSNEWRYTSDLRSQEPRRGPQNTGASGVQWPSASIALRWTESASVVAAESFTVRIEDCVFGDLIASLPPTSSSARFTLTVPRSASMSFQVNPSSSPWRSPPSMATRYIAYSRSDFAASMNFPTCAGVRPSERCFDFAGNGTVVETFAATSFILTAHASAARRVTATCRCIEALTPSPSIAFIDC